MTQCIIIGAGLSGLIAANLLQDAGFSVTVLDKARGVGGRMATRVVAGYRFDHGAQYFTARDPRFVAYVRAWQTAGIVEPWAEGFLLEDGSFKSSLEPRYICTAGMTAIPKHLTWGVDVHLEQRAESVTYSGDQWHIHTAAGDEFSSDALLLTPPVPQSLALLAASAIPLPATMQTRLGAITYEGCYAVMAALAGPSRIEAPGGMWLAGEPLRWIADNHIKGIMPEGHGVTLQAGPEFTRTHWDTPSDTVAHLMIEAAAEWIDSPVEEFSVRRWRYSHPNEVYPELYAFVDQPGPLVLAGDGFAGPRIEGAALSAIAAAERLIQQLTS